MKLAEKILYCRRRAQLSQEALAERVGVSRQAVSKWETGEATPEIGKLLQLAQTFDVTTDWLLSDADPEPTPPADGPDEGASSGEMWQKPPAEKAHTWVDDVPGMLGTLLRRYGWLFGVRLAVAGAAFLAFGLFMGLVSNSFFSGMSHTSFGAPGIQWYDSNGNAISSPDGFFGDFQLSGFGNEFESIQSTGSSMFGLFSGFVTLIGVVLLVAGIILAFELKKLDRT